MINIAFIGTVGVAERHADGLRDIPKARLADVWSRTEKNCVEFAQRHGAKAYRSMKELLADPAISAVFILSTADTHVDYAIAALKAGKHVLVEKPVGLTSADIARLRWPSSNKYGLLVVTCPIFCTRRCERLLHV